MDQSQRRSAMAAWAGHHRVAGYTVRAATTRAVAVTICATAAITGAAPWWVVFALLPAALGTYLSLSAGWYSDRDRLPAEPLARAAVAASKLSEGRMTVNLSGLLEAAGVAGLGVLGPWLMQSSSLEPRLIAVGGALIYAGSFAAAVLIDVAWYNPDERGVSILEWIRRWGCSILSGAFLAVTLPAPWPGQSRWVVAAGCACLVLVQIRVTDADRLLVLGADYGTQQLVIGREEVTDRLHTAIGDPLIHLRRAIRTTGVEGMLHEELVQLESGYREALALAWDADIDLDWPRVLISRLEAIAGSAGVPIDFDAPDTRIRPEDKRIARQVLNDLAMNAVKADARRIGVKLQRTDTGWRATVTDDGQPFRPGAWLRAGGGLQRLRSVLNESGGDLTLRVDDTDRKIVQAQWATPTSQGVQ